VYYQFQQWTDALPLQHGVFTRLGGVSRYEFPNKPPVEGSIIRYNANYGALKVDADAHHLTFQFITIDGKVIDTYTLQP